MPRNSARALRTRAPFWLAWLLVAACLDRAPATGPAGPRLSALEVSTGTLSPAFSSDNLTYSISSLNSLFPIQVTVTAGPEVTGISINGRPSSSGEPTSLRLSPGEDILVHLTSTAGEEIVYRVLYLPPDFPTYQVESNGPHGDEIILLTPGNASLLMVDRGGNPLYYRFDGTTGFIDFRRFRVEGQVVYSFLRTDPQYAQVINTVTGVQMLADRELRDTGSALMLPHGDHDSLPDDAHDFQLLGEDHYVATAYAVQTVDLSGLNPNWSDQAPVVANLVQEVDHGAVVFEWRNTDHPSLYADSVDGNSFRSSETSDYTHLNSVTVDPVDSHFIFSLRHTSSVLKVNRLTGETLWTLGGASDDFGLTAAQRFSHQHHVTRLADGSLLLFDNGNNAHQTRVMSFMLDEAAHTVLSARVIYEKPAELPQTTFMGSAFQLGSDRYLIGWGGWSPPSAAPSVTEVFEGVPVWSLTFDSPTVFSYRAVPISAL
jgi:hypothetical protein